jgi:hypothetical protein
MARLIEKIASLFSTKIAIGVALAWSLIPLVWTAAQPVMFYVSAGIVQLVALPLLAWQQREAERTAKDRHDTTHARIDVLHAHLGITEGDNHE